MKKMIYNGFDSVKSNQKSNSKSNRAIKIYSIIFAIAFFLMAVYVAISHILGSLYKPETGLEFVALHNSTDTVKAKQALADKHANRARVLTDRQKEERNTTFDKIIFETQGDETARQQALEEMGIFKLETSDEIVGNGRSTNASKVTLSVPTVYYDAYTGEWVLMADGSWKNIDGLETPTFWFASVGDEFNIGGTDAVGILLTDTYGDFNGISLMEGTGQFWGDGITATYNRDGMIPSSNGAIFKLQDKIKITRRAGFIIYVYEYSYNAFDFYTHLRYNANFVNYRGNAVLFYAHTWDKTELNGISIGLDSIGVSWSNGSSGWNAIGNDKPF